MKPRRYARGIQFSFAGLTYLSAAGSSLCSDAASAEPCLLWAEASSALIPCLALSDASASASFGTELGVAPVVDAASAAGAGAGISSAMLAFGHARSTSRKLPNASALTTINKARFMIFTFEFLNQKFCFVTQVSHRNLSKEQTRRKTLTASEERSEHRGELLRWPRRFSTLFELTLGLSQSQRIRAAERVGGCRGSVWKTY